MADVMRSSFHSPRLWLWRCHGSHYAPQRTGQEQPATNPRFRYGRQKRSMSASRVDYRSVPFWGKTQVQFGWICCAGRLADTAAMHSAKETATQRWSPQGKLTAGKLWIASRWHIHSKCSLLLQTYTFRIWYICNLNLEICGIPVSFKLLSSAPNFEGLHYSLFSSCSSALACHIQWASGGFLKWGVPLVITHFSRVFH